MQQRKAANARPGAACVIALSSRNRTRAFSSGLCSWEIHSWGRGKGGTLCLLISDRACYRNATEIPCSFPCHPWHNSWEAFLCILPPSSLRDVRTRLRVSPSPLYLCRRDDFLSGMTHSHSIIIHIPFSRISNVTNSERFDWWNFRVQYWNQYFQELIFSTEVHQTRLALFLLLKRFRFFVFYCKFALYTFESLS